MKSDPRVPARRAEQRGAVLIVCLVVLAIVSLLSLNSMRMSLLEQVFANNTQFQASALAVAETGVVSGERRIIQSFPGVPTFDWSTDASDGLYYSGEIADISTIWSASTGYESGDDGSRYVIEYLGPYTTEGASVTIGAGSGTNRRFLYRVTGMGSSGAGGTRLVQSIYATTE